MRTIRDCNVCVVGGAGFLGSQLVDHLIIDRGCNVVVVDNLVAGRKEFIHGGAKFVHHDITGSEDFLRRLFESEYIEYVFNYAAYPYIPVSFKRPLHVFEVNANGAIKVINAAQDAGVKAILQVSSAELYGRGGSDIRTLDEVYYDVGDDGAKPMNESFPVDPHSTYGVAKAAVDYYCQCAWKERNTPVIALRQFNCVGPRNVCHPYVVPAIARQVADKSNWDGEDCTIRLGNNSARDFLYSGDQVKIATELLEHGEFGQVYNLGSEQSVQIYELAGMIGEIMGVAELRIEQDPARIRPWEIWHLQSANDKINSVVPSHPKISLRESLQVTVDYFRSIDWRFPW